MTHLGWRSVLLPALSLAALTACAGDKAGPTGPAAVPLASHTLPGCNAPTISSVSASPTTLWPPNHKFVRVTLGYTVSGGCGTVTTSLSVTSSEPVNGLGDGNTAPDWIIDGLFSVWLRSERSGLGSGRIYTITVTATDAAGHVTTSSVTVFVPHDQRKR